jgi:hypothetical protein
MSVVVTLIHPVDDFERWKSSVLEAIDPVLETMILRRVVYRSIDDPNEVLVQVEFPSIEAAMAHISTDLRDELDRCGIEIYPAAFAGTEVTELRITTGDP